MILRPGRTVGRTLYVQTGLTPSDTDRLVGMVDTVELAALICEAVRRMTDGCDCLEDE